jgi:hypothetical protein
MTKQLLLATLALRCRHRRAGPYRRGDRRRLPQRLHPSAFRLGPRHRDGRGRSLGRVPGAHRRSGSCRSCSRSSWPSARALGVAGVSVPMVETGIAASGLVLGLMVALRRRAPLSGSPRVARRRLRRLATATPTGPNFPPPRTLTPTRRDSWSPRASSTSRGSPSATLTADARRAAGPSARRASSLPPSGAAFLDRRGMIDVPRRWRLSPPSPVSPPSPRPTSSTPGADPWGQILSAALVPAVGPRAPPRAPAARASRSASGGRMASLASGPPSPPVSPRAPPTAPLAGPLHRLRGDPHRPRHRASSASRPLAWPVWLLAVVLPPSRASSPA